MYYKSGERFEDFVMLEKYVNISFLDLITRFNYMKNNSKSG